MVPIVQIYRAVCDFKQFVPIPTSLGIASKYLKCKYVIVVISVKKNKHTESWFHILIERGVKLRTAAIALIICYTKTMLRVNFSPRQSSL